MNLNFINPTFLFGLFACSIPIIIHLIFKKRYRRIKWAAMKFLLAAYRKTKTSLLLENLLLLLLRIVVILLLVLLFARPIARMLPILATSRPAESFIILIDNSYSMAMRGANISPFETAKKQARTIIDKAQKNDSVSLVVMNEQAKVSLAFLAMTSEKKRTEIIQALEEIELSDMATDVETAIFAVKQLVEQPEYPNKSLYIISDCQKNAWERACKKPGFIDALRTIRKNVSEMILVDVGVHTRENLGIVELESEGIVGIGSSSRFIASIRNYGNQIRDDVAVHFYVDGKKQKTEHISLLPDQTSEISFFPNFSNKGNHYVMVELDVDNLVNDNRRYLSFEVLDEIKTLVIDGSPKEGVFESETDYLMAALGTSAQALIKANRINIGELTPEIRFRDYDVVVLANVQSFADEKRFSALENFVERGGGLFIWLGDKVAFEYYNQELFKPGRELLPGELEGPPIGDASQKSGIVFSLQEISEHRIWRYFHLNRRLLEDVRKCFFYRFFPMRIDPEDRSVKVLARFNDHKKHPAFAERRFGHGKVIVATTTADREWHSLHTDQYGHIFVIMLHEFLQYLVSRPREENNLTVGLPIIKRFDFFIQEAQLTPPVGARMRPGIQPLEKGAAHRIHYANTAKSGVYHLELNVPPQIKEERLDVTTSEYFCVNVNPQEGDIAYIAKQELLQRLKTIDLKYEKDLGKQKQQTAKKDTEYWQQLLLLLLALTGLESFLAMWFGRYNK